MKNSDKCVICKQEITADPFGYEGGCNAQPVEDGQCCHPCDINIVLPARLAQYGIGGEDVENVVSDIHKEIAKELSKGKGAA